MTRQPRPKREKKKSAKWHMARAVACPRCGVAANEGCLYTFFEPPKGSEHLTPSMHRERYEAGVAALDSSTNNEDDNEQD